MYYDRLDILLAWYYYCLNWHTGVGSWQYQKLSRMKQYFKPSPASMEDLESYSENAYQIYLDIMIRYEI